MLAAEETARELLAIRQGVPQPAVLFVSGYLGCRLGWEESRRGRRALFRSRARLTGDAPDYHWTLVYIKEPTWYGRLSGYRTDQYSAACSILQIQPP